ncbi:MAG: hypothetical protein LBM93_00715 [Oscillospiraceae bacterium]|jgi:hypothetical protein|nr:hypothetical protein [Oscillospiraceae bacterium]
MFFYDEMKLCKKTLDNFGINTMIPSDESKLSEDITVEEFENFKKKVSLSYLKKIREAETLAILVFNEEKRGIPNYIGANTLAEIVMAFTWRRKVFLLNDIYEPLSDELKAWECTPIHKNYEIVNLYFRENCRKPYDGQPKQMSLFDFLD